MQMKDESQQMCPLFKFNSLMNSNEFQADNNKAEIHLAIKNLCFIIFYFLSIRGTLDRSFLDVSRHLPRLDPHHWKVVEQSQPDVLNK